MATILQYFTRFHFYCSDRSYDSSFSHTTHTGCGYKDVYVHNHGNMTSKKVNTPRTTRGRHWSGLGFHVRPVYTGAFWDVPGWQGTWRPVCGASCRLAVTTSLTRLGSEAKMRHILFLKYPEWRAAMQSQTTASAYFKSKQMLLFGFAKWCGCVLHISQKLCSYIARNTHLTPFFKNLSPLIRGTKDNMNSPANTRH